MRLIPQTRKETIHRNGQERDPKLFSRLPKTKEGFPKALPGPRAEDCETGT